METLIAKLRAIDRWAAKPILIRNIDYHGKIIMVALIWFALGVIFGECLK